MTNMSAMKKLLLLISVLAMGTILTLLSTNFQQSYQAVAGKGCTVSDRNWDGYCFESLPVGGFPLPFLFDSAKTATKGTLGFDDEIYKLLFIADVLVYSLLVALILIGIYSFRNRRKT